MKKKSSLAIILALTMLLSACTSGGSGGDKETAAAEEAGKTVITFWHFMGGVNGEALNQLVQNYNESQDNYFVKAEYQGEYDDDLTKLRASSAGKEVGADIVQVFELGARFMIDSGLIVPV